MQEIILEEMDPVFGYVYIIPVILCYLVLASLCDLRTKKIPNRLNYSFLLIRLVSCAVYPLTLSHLAGGLAGFLCILIPAMIMLVPMGGDIKFSAVLGFWIGYAGIVGSLVIGAVLFIIYGLSAKKKKKEMIAFGPFISAGCVTIMCIYLITTMQYY